MLAADVKALVRRNFELLFGDDSEIDIIEEFPLEPNGGGYADIAILDARSWHGYEIKSEHDSLTRLSHQQLMYAEIFTYCGLIAAGKHLAKAEKMLAEHWGIHELRDGQLILKRPALPNPFQKPESIAAILRRDEWRKWCLDHAAFDLLRGKRRQLAKVCAARLAPQQLMAVVRATVKARGGGAGHGATPETMAWVDDVLRHPEER